MANDLTGYKRQITLGDTIAGEDLTNGWTASALKRRPFKKVALAELFSNTTIGASATRQGNWIDCDGYTKYTLFIQVDAACSVFVQIRPAASTGLQQVICTKTGVTNKALLTNVETDNADYFGAFADEIQIAVTDTGGAGANISAAYLFLAA